MTIKHKLEIIQRMTGLTQTQLATRLGVSFVAFNNWWTGKAVPRLKMQAAIDELLLEVTGQATVPTDQLTAKKQILHKQSSQTHHLADLIVSNPDIRDELILKLTYHSNSIEGSTLTELDTAAVLFDNVALSNKSLSEQLEAKNHQTALNYLFASLASSENITEQLVLKLHSILMNGIRSDAGVYRNHAVRILGVSLPTANFASVPKLTGALMKEAAGHSTDVIGQATGVHAHFEQIHPFSDGNGRVGRLLMSAMLVRNNYAPAIIRQEQKRLYYTCLNKAQTTNDQSQLENYLCDAVLDGFRIVQRSDVS